MHLDFRFWRPAARGALLGLAALLALRAPAQTVGPVSNFYLTAGDQSNILVVQGTTVVNTIPEVSAEEYPVYVLGGNIQTAGDTGSTNGHEYTLGGTPTGPAHRLPVVISSAFDATTDGTHSYTIEYATGIVYQMNLDYTSPVALFTSEGLSLTYDSSNNSLWVASFSGNSVTDYSLGGTVLSSFTASAAAGRLSCLALDPATGTFWLGSQLTEGTFYEYDRTGTFLGSVTYAALTGQNTLGGEFAFTAIPEPTAATLLAVGGLGLVLLRRGRFRSSPS